MEDHLKAAAEALALSDAELMHRIGLIKVDHILTALEQAMIDEAIVRGLLQSPPKNSVYLAP